MNTKNKPRRIHLDIHILPKHARLLYRRLHSHKKYKPILFGYAKPRDVHVFTFNEDEKRGKPPANHSPLSGPRNSQDGKFI